MKFRLVDSGWDKVLDAALAADHAIIRVVCPFIKKRGAERLLKYGRPKTLQVITRFNLDDFCNGVSDVNALRCLLDHGARIRGVRDLHAKMYVFGTKRAIVTSANLTDAAMLRNHEFGFVAEGRSVIDRCCQYFDDFWKVAGADLVASRLRQWDSRIKQYLLTVGAKADRAIKLGDEGVNARVAARPLVSNAWFDDAEQAFVKFFGEGNNRAERSMLVLDELRGSGSHWACTYPRNKRPRQVEDAAIMFIGRMVKDPDDILIYGRAIGMHYEPGRDDATAADIRRRPWKKQWPRYVRVHSGEFIRGPLSNGVSLRELEDALKSNAYASTQKHAADGKGNIDPRRAYRQMPAVQLSANAINWLNNRLESAFARHGVLSSELKQLDWPQVPRT